MMKHITKRQVTFNDCEPNSIFLKNHLWVDPRIEYDEENDTQYLTTDLFEKTKGYFTTNTNKIVPLCQNRNISSSEKYLNKIAIRAIKSGWTGTYKDGAAYLINGIQSYSQESLEYYPWIEKQTAAFRIIINENNISLIDVSQSFINENYISPVDRIDLIMHKNTNQNQWLQLDSAVFYGKETDDLNSTKCFDIVNKNGQRSKDKAQITYEGEHICALNINAPEYYIVKSRKSGSNNLGYFHFKSGERENIGNGNSNNGILELAYIIFEKFEKTGIINDIVGLNYDNPDDIYNKDKLIILDWCRYYDSSETEIKRNNYINSCINCFYTILSKQLDGSEYYNFGDWSTHKNNMLTNTNPNSDPSFVKYLIDQIQGGGIEGKDVYSFKYKGEELFKLKFNWCNNDTDYYIEKIENSDYLFAEIDNEGSLGNKNNIRPDDVFKIKRLYKTYDGKILRFYIFGQKTSNDYYIIYNYIEVH